MSRIGKLPVPLPDGVKAEADGATVRITGPLGQMEHPIDRRLSVEIDEAERIVRVTRANDEREVKALHGLLRVKIANMVEVVTKGYAKTLQVVGIGYSAKLDGNELLLQVGLANTLRVPIPEGLTIDPPESGNLYISGVGSVPCANVRIRGIDKQKVGDLAARIRRLRPPEPYRGKGIRYLGEEVRRKAGKAFAAQE